MTKRATIYIKDDLYRALKLKAAEQDETLSNLVNAAIQLQLSEDVTDLEIVKERRKHAERNFSTFVRELRRDGHL